MNCVAASCVVARKVSVLWAEDSPDDQLLIRTALEDLGTKTEVTFVGDGVHLLAALKKNSVDLVVLDLKMPRLGGLDTLRKLRESAGGRNQRVGVFSAGNQPDEIAQCRALGAVAVEQKPISFDEFTQAVARMLEHAKSSKSPSGR